MGVTWHCLTVEKDLRMHLGWAAVSWYVVTLMLPDFLKSSFNGMGLGGVGSHLVWINSLAIPQCQEKQNLNAIQSEEKLRPRQPGVQLQADAAPLFGAGSRSHKETSNGGWMSEWLHTYGWLRQQNSPGWMDPALWKVVLRVHKYCADSSRMDLVLGPLN